MKSRTSGGGGGGADLKRSQKKRALTADDLLRLQEEPVAKRMKMDERARVKVLREEVEEGSEGTESEEESGSEEDVDGAEEGTESEEDSDGEGEGEENASEGDRDEEAAQVDQEDADESDDEPFSFSGPQHDVEDRFASALRSREIKERETRLQQSRHKAKSTKKADMIKAATEESKEGAEAAPLVQPTPAPVATFISLGISSPLRSALKSMSITAPTEVQAACIPPILAGRDCIGNAKTGSGKTIAFALPILQKLLVDPYGIFALVLTPTRELAFQIAEQFAVLGGSVNVRTAVVVGGMDMMAQALELDSRPHVVIATPGRMVDHLKSTSGGWDLSRVKFLVLDEADRLLTPTFSAELGHIFGALSKERQTCLFTATLTESIETLAEATPRPGKMKPFVHRMKESVETVSTLKQHYILVPSHVREAYLFRLLCNPPESTIHLRRGPPESGKKKKASAKKGAKKSGSSQEEEIVQPPPTIIFCARTKSAAYLTLLLKTLGIRSTSLHSRLTQRDRLSSLQLFRASVVPVLVSTDVGARGLDIPDVAMVVNWDLPEEPEEYTHRVGRTARAGKGGVAISFVTERDEERVLRIEKRINTQLAEMTLNEEKVLEKLNAVSTAKRVANMELYASDFGKREEVNMQKRA